MSNEGSIPSGRAAPESLENQQLADRATGQASSAWSGLGPKLPPEHEQAGARFPRVGEVIESCAFGETAHDWKRFTVVGVAADGWPIVVAGGNKYRVTPMEWRWPVDDPMVCPGCSMPAESLDPQWGLCPKCTRERGERASLNDDPGATRGKGGALDDVPAIPEPKRCKGLTEMNHAWECDAVLGADDGDQCAHCRNLETQIRAEDLAVEETERQDAQQAVAYEQLLKAHQGDARAVVIGVLRTMVAIGAVTEAEESSVHDAAVEVTRDMFEYAEHLQGVPLLMFWSLLADIAAAERNCIRRGGEEAYRGVA